jgi:hypothetical protein
MKILEILNPSYKQITPRKGIRGRQHKGAIDRTFSRLGYGAYAKVYASKNPLDAYKKSTADDGFQFYVRGILQYNKSKGQLNPYFPNFYRVNEFKAKDSEASVMHLKMERLNEIDDLNIEDLKEMMVKMFGDSDVAGDAHKTTYVDDIVDRIEEYCLGRNLKIVDFRLEEALELIKELVDKHDLRLDIHEGNVMWRRSPQGPQLVITDPLVLNDGS